MSQLTLQRSASIAGGRIPALVDSAAWTNLHLAPGASFELSIPTYGALVFVAEAEINSIPTIGDSPGGDSSGTVPAGAVRVGW